MSSFYGNGGYSSGGGGGSGEVISVNGKKGQVTLNAADVHALPEDTLIPSLEGFATEAWVNNLIGQEDKKQLPPPSFGSWQRSYGSYPSETITNVSIPFESIVGNILEQNYSLTQRSIEDFLGLLFRLYQNNYLSKVGVIITDGTTNTNPDMFNITSIEENEEGNEVVVKINENNARFSLTLNFTLDHI